MKTKLVIILLATYAFTSTTFAQTISTKSGESVSCKFKDLIYDFKPVASYNRTFTYLLIPNEEIMGKYGYEFTIEQYDDNMNLVKSEPVILNEGDKYIHENELIYFHGKLHLISSYQDETSKKVFIQDQIVDKNTLAIHPDKKVLSTIQYDKLVRNIRLRTGFAISKDSSKLLIHTFDDKIKYVQIQRDHAGKETAVTNQHLFVFDKDMNLIWKQDLGNALEHGLFTSEKFNIDNAGDVFVTGKSYPTEVDMNGLYMYTRKRHGDVYYTNIQPSNYQESILCFYQNGKRNHQFNFSPKNIFIKNVTIRPEGDEIMCAGVYSEPKMVSAKGVFSCKVKVAEKSIENMKLHPFKAELLQSILDDDDLQKFHKVTSDEEWDPFGYSLSSLKKLANGNYLFIAEQQLYGKLESSSGQMTAIYPTFQYANLYVTEISPNLEDISVQKIGKSQFGLGMQFHSYQYLLSGNDLYLIYNIIPMKLGLMKVAELQKSMLVHIDENGVRSDKIIASYDKNDKKTTYMVARSAMPSPKLGFIYPMQSMTMKYRSYGLTKIDQ